MSALSKAKEQLKAARSSAGRRMTKERQMQLAGGLTVAVTGGVLGQMKKRGVQFPGIPGLPKNMTTAVVFGALTMVTKGTTQRVVLDVAKSAIAVASYELGLGQGVSGHDDDDGFTDLGDGDGD